MLSAAIEIAGLRPRDGNATRRAIGISRRQELRIRGDGRQPQNQNVLVHHEVDWQALGAALAEHGELEEGVAGEEPIAAHGGEQRHTPFQGLQASGDASGHDLAGQVDQVMVAAPGAGGDHDDPTGFEERDASGEDAGEPGEQITPAAMSEVRVCRAGRRCWRSG